MSKYENRADIAAKADWEGGFDEFYFGYGLHLDELPENDEELKDAFIKLEAAATVYDVLRKEFIDLLPDSYE